MSFLILTALGGIAVLAALAVLSWHLEMRERDALLAEEALMTAQVLDEELQRRLSEMNAYRHELAELLQEIGPEQVRAAEERAQN